jgi:hypothetical protein
LLDFINVMAFKNVMLPGLLLQANNYFVDLSCEIVFPRMLFKEERRNELNAVLSQTHADGQKLYTWVEKNKLISPTTRKNIRGIVQSARMSYLQWMEELDKRSKRGDVNAVSLRINGSRPIHTCSVCKTSTSEVVHQPKSADDPVTCRNCHFRAYKECCRYGKTKTGRFHRDKTIENGYVCIDCQTEDFICSRYNETVYEKPIGNEQLCKSCRSNKMRSWTSRLRKEREQMMYLANIYFFVECILWSKRVATV